MGYKIPTGRDYAIKNSKKKNKKKNNKSKNQNRTTILQEKPIYIIEKKT